MENLRGTYKRTRISVFPLINLALAIYYNRRTRSDLHSIDDRLLDQDPLEDTGHALTHAPDLARGTGTVTETDTEEETEELDSHHHLYTLTSEWVKVETVQEVNNQLEEP